MMDNNTFEENSTPPKFKPGQRVIATVDLTHPLGAHKIVTTGQVGTYVGTSKGGGDRNLVRWDGCLLGHDGKGIELTEGRRPRKGGTACWFAKDEELDLFAGVDK